MNDEIRALEEQLLKLKEQLATARKSADRQAVDDHMFTSTSGEVRLSSLFNDKTELFVVHNMGRSCNYCTLWADGLNGLTRHIEDRAGFAVCSPDPVDVQAEFAISRGWIFKMVSDQSKEFTRQMGFWTEEDGWWPGVSGFVKEGDKIYRTGRAVFGPGDDFCGIWPMMELVGGDKGWEPKLSY